jgi:selenide,water dikinase
LGSGFLAETLKDLPQSAHPDLLVGFNKADDAGVFRISDDLAIVQTVDFFPPIVDDAYHFGRIAAANALSDVFAMGGRPLTAMNIVGFPAGIMPQQILTDVLRGGNEKVEEAGAVVVGGHSIKDKELKFGISVTGVVHPDKIVTNSGAKVGDRLFLTKPLGTGLITTGIKRDAVDGTVIDLVIEQMAQLNKVAADLMIAHHATAATDITGFGLLGHALEVAEASGVTFRIDASSLPLLPRATDLVKQNMIPGGANDNRSFLQGKVHVGEGVDPLLEAVLYDPQTSGGLLVAIPEKHAEDFSAALSANNLPSAMVGSVEAQADRSLIVD